MEKPQDNDTMPLRDGFNFTPYHQGERCRMRVSAADARDGESWTRGPGYKGIVTDLDTGIRYRVVGRACDLPRCFCDAEISEI